MPGPDSCHDQPRDRPQPGRPRLSSPEGPRQVLCPPPRGVERSPQADRRAVAAHPEPAEGRLESRADRGPPKVPGRGDGGQGVDLPSGAGRSQGGRRAVPAELAGRGHIPGRVDIAERPAVAEQKSRIGARHRGGAAVLGGAGLLVHDSGTSPRAFLHASSSIAS